jgi:hypothetical protein
MTIAAMLHSASVLTEAVYGAPVVAAWLDDVANGSANNSHGHPRMHPDQAAICNPREQASLTTAD